VSRNHDGWKRGIRIGSARDGSVTAFIPDPVDKATTTSAAEGVAADADGNIYGAEVGPKGVKKYVRAPAIPRTADGKPDFTGVWTPAGGQGALDGLETLRVDPDAIKPWARDLIREREQDIFKSRPDFQCRPSGPEAENNCSLAFCHCGRDSGSA